MRTIDALPETAWAGLVDLPYLDGGRGPDAYDCVGVMEAVLRAAFGIEGDLAPGSVPPEGVPGPWRWISLRDATRTPGAVIVTRNADDKLHVWTVIDRDRVISTLCDRGVSIVSMRLVARGPDAIVGCYLHEGIR